MFCITHTEFLSVIAVSKSHEFLLKVRRLSSFFRRRRKGFDFDDESTFFPRRRTLSGGNDFNDFRKNQDQISFCLSSKNSKFDVTPKEASPSASLPLRVIEMCGAVLGIIKLTSMWRHGNYEPRFGVLYHITIRCYDPASLCR